MSGKINNVWKEVPGTIEIIAIEVPGKNSGRILDKNIWL